MISIEEEVNHIYDFLNSPICFGINIDMAISIKLNYKFDWEINWEEFDELFAIDPNPSIIPEVKGIGYTFNVRTFPSLEEAVKFFVNTRRRLKIGPT